MADCELLILGSDCPYRQFYPQGGGVRIAQVDIRPEHLGRRAAVDLPMRGDIRATLTDLVPRLGSKSNDERLNRAKQHFDRAGKQLDGLAEIKPGSQLIHPQQIAKVISDQAAENAVFSCDVGLPTVRAARYLAMSGQRRFLVLARFYGRCHGPGNRGTGHVSPQAGDFPLWRQRLYGADARFAEPCAT